MNASKLSPLSFVISFCLYVHKKFTFKFVQNVMYNVQYISIELDFMCFRTDMRTKIYVSYIFCLAFKHKMIFNIPRDTLFQAMLTPFSLFLRLRLLQFSIYNLIGTDKWGIGIVLLLPIESCPGNWTEFLAVTSSFSKNVHHIHLCLEIFEVFLIESQKWWLILFFFKEH